MKSNIKLNKLFNLNNMFTLLLIVILILVIVCCVRKSKSNKENFLDWTPLPCNEKGETDWDSPKHFGDVRCLDGEYGSAGAGNDDRAKALGGFLEFTAANKQADGKGLSDFVNKTSQVMNELEVLSALLYMKFIYGLNLYDGKASDGSENDQGDQYSKIRTTILDNFRNLVFPEAGSSKTVDPKEMSRENANNFKTECIKILSKSIKDNNLDPSTKSSFNSSSSTSAYFQGIEIINYKKDDGVIVTTEQQITELQKKYNWRKGDTKKKLLLDGNKDDDDAKWDEDSAIIAFENELRITYFREKQEIEAANAFRKKG